MTNIDFTNEESVNYILNYSQMLINEMAKTKTERNDCYKTEQAIILAAMISYYGFENLDTVYKAFEKTYFSDEIKPLDSKDKNGFIDAYCNVKVSNSLKNLKSLKIDRTIYFGVKPLNESQKIKTLVHETNHIVNSMISPICKRNNFLVFRNGMAINSLDSRYRESVYFEEAINESQALEIFDIIDSFRKFDIKNSSINQEIQKINSDTVIPAYPILITSLKPLYRNREFNYILKNKRLTGDLKEIREHFDDKVGIPNAFQDLSKKVDELNKNPNPLTMKRVMGKAYQYTKKQI